MVESKTIAVRLKALRLENHLTLEQVGEAIGVSKQAVSAYESGLSIPNDENKIKIAQLYGKPIQDIFFAREVHNLCTLTQT
jgi:transcriptional regulator with XRE-family HTH domain